MIKCSQFRVYRLNIDAKVNAAINFDLEGTPYEAANGDGNCYFTDSVSVWRQADDWYCSIHCDEEATEEAIASYVQAAYDSIYDEAQMSIEDRHYNPTLLFYNKEIC